MFRLRSRPSLWLAALYLGVCTLATLIVVGMMIFAPAQSKFLAVWLLLLSLPWSDWVLSAVGPQPLALWGGVLAGYVLNAAALWGASATIIRLARCVTGRFGSRRDPLQSPRHRKCEPGPFESL